MKNKKIKNEGDYSQGRHRRKTMKKITKVVAAAIIALMAVACSGKLARVNYVNKNIQISKHDDMIILPTVVMKEIKLGNKALEAMYDTLMFTILKEQGFDVIASDAIHSFLKEKSYKIEDIKKTSMKEIDEKIITEMKSKFNAKYVMQLVLISHTKEDLLNEKSIFASLKVYAAGGNEVAVINSHYEGEHGVGSAEVVKNVKELITEFMKVQGK